MNIKVTIGLLAIFIAAMVVYLLVDDPPPTVAPTLSLWPDFSASDVTAMSFVSSSGEIHVRRSEGDAEEWEVRAGDSWVPGEADLILDVLNELERLDVRSRQPGDEVDAQLRQDAGLDPATHWLTFEMRGKTHRVDFGGKGIGRDTVYAAVPDSDDLIVMGDGLLDSILPLTTDLLRRRRIFRWSVLDVDRVEIEIEGRKVLSAKRLERAQAFWWAEVPFQGYLGDEAMENRLLGRLLMLKADRFVSDRADPVVLGEAGLIEPRVRIRLHKGRGKDETATVLFGGDAGEGRVHFRLEERAAVFAGNVSELLDHISSDPATWRDRNLSRLAHYPVAEFSGELDGTRFRVKREEGTWSVLEPEGMTADAGSVEAWFDAVRALTVIEFVDRPDPAALGLDEPRGRLTFLRPLEPDERAVGATVPPLVDLRIGNETDRGVYVMRARQDDPAFLAPKAILEIIRGGAWQFRARAVFSFRPRGSAPTRVERRAGALAFETDWKDEAWTANADPKAIRDLVTFLIELKAARWVGPAAGNEEEYGVGAAPHGSLLVTFGEGAGAIRYGLLVGRETTGGRFARAVREGVPGEAVFILSKSAWDTLSLSLEKK